MKKQLEEKVKEVKIDVAKLIRKYAILKPYQRDSNKPAQCGQYYGC